MEFPSAPYRDWTSKDGRKNRGRLIEILPGGRGRFQLENDKEFVVKFTDFSVEDRLIIKQLIHAQ